MLFWHVGGTLAITRYAFRDERMDLRLLIAGSILPGVIDTPIGLVGFGTFHSVRLAAHSVLFAAVVMVAIMVATRRGRPRKRWMPLAVGILIHLVLDGMWADPRTLWWPFMGLGFSPSEATSAGGLVVAVLTDWRTWALEAVGLAYLVVLGVKAKLGTAEARERFRRTGRIAVPIGRG